MSKQKKTKQLGMNPSTASGRLVKDLLFNFIELNGHKCYRCKKPMTRETFSIEHKESWLDSDDPAGLYFDISNIAYSHISCNSRASRRFTYATEDERKQAVLESNRRSWTPEKRKEYYEQAGK